MSAEKFSVSFEKGLAKTVRRAAAKEGLSISSWLAEAAAARARQRHLRDALDAFAAEHGELDEEEIETLVRNARESSQITKPRRPAAKGSGGRRSPRAR